MAKFKAGDKLIDKYTEDSTPKPITIVSIVDNELFDHPCYIVDYMDNERPVIRSQKVIEKYYKLQPKA